MKNIKIALSIFCLIMVICPYLMYAQDSYEEQLKQKLDQETPPATNMYSDRKIDEWLIGKGRWDMTGETIKYNGVSDVSEEYGVIFHTSERLWNGSFEASVIFTEAFLKNDKSALCFLFSYNPVTDDRYEFCFGRYQNDTKLAYRLGDVDWKKDGNKAIAIHWLIRDYGAISLLMLNIVSGSSSVNGRPMLLSMELNCFRRNYLVRCMATTSAY